MRAGAALAAFSGLMFGIPGVFGMWHLAQTGEVWTFLGFPTYGKGPFETAGIPTSMPLQGAFVVVCTTEVVTASLLWRRSRPVRRCHDAYDLGGCITRHASAGRRQDPHRLLVRHRCRAPCRARHR